MKCLDPLKGTGGLVDGFEEFVSEWLVHPEPKQNPINFTDTEETVFRRFPSEVCRFYEIVHRWPGAKIVCDNNQDAFITPPRFHRRWQKGKWIEDDRYAPLGIENQDCWEVVIGLEGDETGRLFTDMDDEGGYPGYWIPMNSRPDEFLVTLGFHELILCADVQLRSDANPMDGAKLLFTGRYQGDYIQKVFFRDDGILWLTNESERPWWVCARRPESQQNTTADSRACSPESP